MKPDRHVANLKPFPKGASGNPGGRPKTKRITDEIKKQLEDACKYDGAKRTNLVVGVEKLMGQWVGGMPHAQKLVLEYIDGPPTQTIDIRGEVTKLAERLGMDADELYQRTLRLIEGRNRSG